MRSEIQLPVEISPNGGVCLGPNVICDGFKFNVPFRVQSHVHDDHMNGWSDSKGYQEIYMTPATHALLVAELNADLSARNNLHRLNVGEWCSVGGCRIRLESSAHMLGAAQVCVELECGARVGYSGDFAWPMDNPIEVDVLVLDSTNGSPKCMRQYEESEADESFMDILRTRIKYGPVYLKAHRGTLQRALQVMCSDPSFNILASKNRIREIDVFRQFGFPMPKVIDRKSEEGVFMRKNGHCVYLYSKGDGQIVDPVPHSSTISLSAYFTNPKTPVNVYSDRSFCVAMCEHADFEGCLEYVKKTKARHVLVDVRGSKHVELAIEIRNRLGVNAIPASVVESKEWGI